MKKKLLNCPVADKNIKPAVCGANRISRYNCPESCPHNLWSPANYSKSLEIYDRFRNKLYSRMRTEGISEPPFYSNESDLYKTVIWFCDKLYIKKDSNGLTFKQRWEKNKYAGLNNDQKILINAEESMHPTLLEIQQILDDHTFIAVDLLRPEEGAFLMADYALASTACRFSVLFALTFNLPHYRRINITGVDFSFIPGIPPVDAFNELTRHLGAPQNHEQMLQWLSSHVADIFTSIQEVANARQIAAQNNLRAFNVHTIYTINCTQNELLDVIDHCDEMIPEELNDEKEAEGFNETWAILEDDFESKVQQEIIGTLFLHQDNYIRLEVLTQTDKNPLKSKIQKIFGNKIKFKLETKEDISDLHTKGVASSYNPALVSPALLKNLPDLKISSFRIDCSKLPPSSKSIEVQIIEQQINDFLDCNIQSLNNKTPREAAKIPQLRPQLILLMKMHTRNRDKHNLEKGLNIDFNKALSELGLDEIIFPPPPPRKIQPDDDFDEEDYCEDGFLPPLSPEDIEGLIRIIDKTYNRKERLEQLKKRFPDFCNAVKVICKKTENMQLASTIYDAASYAVFLIVSPTSSIGEEIYNPDLFYDNFATAVQIFTEDYNVKDEPQLTQPYIAQMIINKITNHIPENNKELGNIISQACILTIALVETLEEALSEILN